MTPLSYWLWFHAAILVLMAVEYLLHRVLPEPRRKAAWAIGLWLVASLAFAALLFKPYGVTGSTQFLAGYVLEQSLSLDNLFVFLLLFRAFQIPERRQPRILFFGVAGAIVLRGLFIAAGVSLLDHFHWLSYVLGALLLVAAIRVLLPSAPENPEHPQQPRWMRWLASLSPVSLDCDHFFVREAPPATATDPSPAPRRMVTILFLALVAIEITDVLFALDSIPAVLSITRQPFIAYTSNILAVMGLRSFYILLAAMLSKLRFLHYGLAALLGFAALKMLAEPWLNISPLAALLVTVSLLAITLIASKLAPPKAVQ